MAAFRYLGATISSLDKEGAEVIASAVIFTNPTIMEFNYRTSLYDVAKRYRQIKSIDDAANIMVVKINDEITTNKKALLSSVVKARFTYADLLALSVSSTPVIEDAMYIESGLDVEDVKKLVPEWYEIVNTRTTVKLRKSDDLVSTS